MMNKMKIIIKKLAIILWNFFIALTITTFLVSLLSLLRENTTNTITLVFSTCGCALLIVIVVYWRFKDIVEIIDFHGWKKLTKKE